MLTDFMPDLIVSDIMMPGMNGFDFCRTIKDKHDTCHIPVILLSARTSTDDLLEGSECLADVYITKPFELSYLLSTINNLLENRRKIIEKYKDNIHAQYGKALKEDSEKELIDQVISITRNNLSSPTFSVDFVANEIGVGRTKLYKQVKEITGITLGELIRDIKMKTAVQLMLTTDTKISEIAIEVGISPNFFYTMFKDYYGMTPSEYIKAQRG
jgi:YesN/AraC family two-component response regulator